MNMKIKKLMEQRNAALAAARAILDAAEGRALTAEEQKQYDGFDADVDKLSERIKAEERQEQREREMATSQNGGNNPARDRQPGGEGRGEEKGDREYRQALVGYLAGSGISERLVQDVPERRAILGVNITTPATGGVLAPTELERVVLDFAKEFNVMRGLATVRSSASNVEIPVATGKTTAYHLDEGADFTRSTPSWEKVPMGAHKIGALSVVTHEALEDIFIDLESWVRDDFARAFARLEEQDFTTGNGEKKPRGFLLDATVGVTTTSATAIVADELIDLQHALPQQYRNAGVFMVSDAALKAIRKLKTTDNQYIWQPGLQAGLAGTLLGQRVVTNEFMDSVAATKKPVAFGDFSAYRVLDRRGLFFQRLAELYATSGQVGFLAYKRYDGRLLDVNAVKVLQMKAV